ncbi:cytochrome P450 [Trametes versicolor FP-101664 SS1]|uniref:cytochrome P450 n=1 Tax=Trametes versicolor (strain FP-101664) TaxID=717944 RepID=UPI0004622D01|nr:cytochrome P450 [Trametes versicolor FP-101664 SS1]EIW55336.1 cytochrome P450 [Trametes versicolor FP-101664 SS1]
MCRAPRNALQISGRQSWDFHAAIARKYGPVIKLHWLFGTSALYVFDLLALNHIIKDQEKFDQPPWTHNMMLGPGLLSVTGDTHRKQRKMLTPVFSAKHLRTVVPIFYEVTDKLIQAISARVPMHSESTDMDVLGWMSRAALELICRGGIGYSFDPLIEDVSDAYAEAAKYFVVTATSPETILLRQMAPFLKHLGPSWLLHWVMEKSPMRLVRRIVQITHVLHERSLDIFRAKRAAIEAGDDSDSKDILSIMLRANMEASGEDRLPEDQLLGQMSTIIFAAMDTTSNAMARTLQLLAEYPQVQTKLRREIADAKAGGNHLDYDQLHALSYLDASPGSPHDFPTSIRRHLVSILACNRDKALWGPDADEWKPERWLAPLPAAVESAAVPGVYSNMMTFSGGARGCIGFTFSQLEMKVVLSEKLAHFTFELSERPVVWNIAGVAYPTVTVESTKQELWLRVRKVREE